MEVAGAPAVDHVSHRVADPQDPPRELSGLGWGVLVSLGLLAILGVIRILAALDLHSVVGDKGDIASAYDRYATWSGLHDLLFVVTAGAFIAWFFRAYKNLRRLGVENMRYRTGWAIGAWFIPIFSLIRPKQIANDVWRGSERGVDVSAQWHEVTVPILVHWWWGLFVLQGFLIQLGEQRTDSGYEKLTSFGGFESLTALDSSLSQIESGATIDVIGAICSIVAAVLAIMVVTRISSRLDELRSDVLRP